MTKRTAIEFRCQLLDERGVDQSVVIGICSICLGAGSTGVADAIGAVDAERLGPKRVFLIEAPDDGDEAVRRGRLVWYLQLRTGSAGDQYGSWHTVPFVPSACPKHWTIGGP